METEFCEIEYIKDLEIAKNCFEYVRDNINHTGEHKDNISTIKASDVLKYKTGWCYAKSHLLASLLRANNIPTGFCYQRLSCSEYKDDIYCLHGLNAIYLKEYGWYKVDARGNKEGVNAQFNPPIEKLAFELEENEFNLPEIYAKPLEVVVQTLEKYKTADLPGSPRPQAPESVKEHTLRRSGTRNKPKKLYPLS
ncbi:MAG: transglutaminase domain-containing protein [Campylobacterales bacterium]|nr:transglutaminase domain-containing protein [Campylobacterales bacterium]